MSNYSYFTDPGQEFFLSLTDDQAQLNQRIFEQMSRDPQMMGNLAQYSTMYPTGSAELGLALAQGGIPASDPTVQQYVNEELATRSVLGPYEQSGGGLWDSLEGAWNEAVFEPTKGAARWGFAAWDAAYQMLAGGAPLRARELAQQERISFSEAWKKQDPYFLEAVGGLLHGERVNLGSGWMPNSDVAPDVQEQVNLGMESLERETSGMGANERYTHILEGSPQVWSDAVANSLQQGVMGKPIVPMNYADTESVMFNVNSFTGNKVRTPWSPGRMVAANFVEPGTEPYKKISAFGDFGAQIFLDPVDWIGGFWAKSGVAGRKLWGVSRKAAEAVDEVAEVARTTQLALGAGAETVAGALPAGTPTRAMEAAEELVSPRLAQGSVSGAEPERLTPWWVSGRDGGTTPSHFRAPEWFMDIYNFAIGRRKGLETSTQRVSSGVYRISDNVNGGRLFAAREGDTWKIYEDYGKTLAGENPNPYLSVEGDALEFGTLSDAEKYAQGELKTRMPEMEVGGMTAEEFLDSGEDFYVDDYRRVGKSTGGYGGPDESRVAHRVRNTPEGTLVTKNGDNAKVRVFGRTVDISSGRLSPDTPEGLRAALRRDGKLRGDNLVGFNDPNIDKFDNTMRWMDDNGVGKLKWDDETILISDKYIGGTGNPDPVARMHYESPDKPMATYPGGYSTPTPNDIDEVVQFVSNYERSREPIDVLREIRRTRKELAEASRNPLTDVEDITKRMNALEAEYTDLVSHGGRPATFREGVRETGGGVTGEGFSIPGIDRAHPGTVGSAAEEAIDPRGKTLAERILEADANATPSHVYDGVRPDFDPDYVLQGKKVDQFIEALSATTRRGGQASTAAMDRLLSFIDDAGVALPNSVRRRLFEAESEHALRSILAEYLVKEGGQEVLLPGGLQFGRLGTLTGNRFANSSITAPRAITRRFAQGISGEANMVDDPSGTYGLYNNVIGHFNLRRGDVVQAYDKNGNAIDNVWHSVESLFDRLRDLDPGNPDPTAAYILQGDFQQLLFSSLVSDGVDPKLANYATDWWRTNGEMALFEAERFGRPDLGSSPLDMTLVNDELIGGLGPQVTADLWNGVVKPMDPRTIKRVANESDLLGRISNRMAWKWVDEDGAMKIQDRALMMASDAIMQKVWKPFVLLRAAWTLRILMDDQFRLAAEGYSIFSHPLRVINYAIANPDDLRSAFKTGTVDVYGVKMSIEHLDEMMHGSFFRDSLMKAHDSAYGPGAYGKSFHRRAGKGTSDYIEGLAFEVQRLRGSRLTKMLANSKADDPVEQVVKWLMGEGPASTRDAAMNELRQQAGMHRKMGDVYDKILARDRETIENIVNRQYGILHHRLGGDVVLDTGQGQLMNFAMTGPVGSAEETGRARWVVRSPGDRDLLDIVVGSENLSDGRFIGNLSSEDSLRQLESLLRSKVRQSEFFPNHVRAPKADTGGKGPDSLGDMYDKALSGFFNWAMTKPSNQFSRVPEFNRAYWDKISDLYPYMDDALRSQIDELATNPRAKEAIQRARKDKRGAEIAGQLTDMEQVDLHAKAYGMAMVERTLFTLESKHNISDSLRLVFPFVEAWTEFITRWGRLMVYGDRNVKNVNRLRQAVGGARRSGFFQENEYGQEVFNYPAFLTKGQVGLHNTLNNIPGLDKLMGGDVDQDVAGAIQAQGNVESLNFASGIIPGFGPVFQMAAKALPANPDYDWVRELVAPFGTEGGMVVGFAPAWLKRVVSAHGGADDPTLTYAYNSTVLDVIRTKIDSGDFSGVTDPASINRLVREAEEEAKGLLMVRAAATFWNPASPQYRFQKEDADGLVWSYNNLGGELYKMIEENDGDDAAAMDQFIERFGFLPHPFKGGKSYSTVDRSRTVEGNKFERAHPQLFEDYPSIAMYLDPQSGLDSEYDHGATLQQLKEGTREGWTGEQFIYLQQDQLGDLWWDNVQQQAILISDSGTRKAYESSMRSQIQEAYPYWNQKIPGKRQSVTNDQQREELLRAASDPALNDVRVFDAVRHYENLRNQVLEQLRRVGASTIDGPSSTTTEAGIIATRGRQFLREKSEELAMQFPEWKPLFDSIYAFEVSETHDAIEPPKIDAFGEGDIFEELGMTDGT